MTIKLDAIAGLVPAIHIAVDMDHRDKPGGDEEGVSQHARKKFGYGFPVFPE